MNNDGFDDVVVGARFGARVLSGPNGSELYRFNGGGGFGHAVGGAGDVNRDGFDDVIVGDYTDLGETGSATVFSGQDGRALHTLQGDAAEDRFGWSVSGAGDVDNDGFDDVIVGAVSALTGRGSAKVFSGRTGMPLFIFNGELSGDFFGESVGAAGDVNSDGHADLIVGAAFDDVDAIDDGSVSVLSGRDGTPLYTFNGDSGSDLFGWAVSGAGDVNGDGISDLLVGAPTDFGAGDGYARVFASVVTPACVGDVNEDGFVDVFDFSDLAANFGAGPGATREQGDLTGDGFVDVFDFSELAANFGCDAD